MKNCFIAIALFLTGVLAAADAAVLRFAPDSTVAVVGIELAGLMKHPDVISTLNEPENKARRQEIEKSVGVKLSDFEKFSVLVNARGEAIVLAEMNAGLNIEQIFLRNKLQFKKFKIGACDVLQLTKPVKNGKIIEVATLAPGVILAGEKGDIAKYFAQKRGKVASGLRQVVTTVPAHVPFWLAFVNIVKCPDRKINDPQSLFLTFDFAGKNKRDYALTLVLDCAGEQGAQIMQGMVPMYVNMGISMGINDPALAAEVAGCIKAKVSGRRVIVSALMSEALGQKIGSYFKANASRFLPGKQQAAPAGNGSVQVVK